MKEIEIIKLQLRKLAKKGYHLDIVNDAICLIDTNNFMEQTDNYEKSTNKHDAMKKGNKINGDIVDESKYIICTF